MYDWWVLQLAKLSVSRKLMVGFGVLLALLLLVVISSNRTLTHQTALSEQRRPRHRQRDAEPVRAADR
ncbi:hypothetical protein ACLBVF_34435, partial [Pseudomonas aeruginosa]|uniref:hypothetical protein n=1 Tax=Pseudomonas aeruginosa TaxID=287 RepID=UPI003968C624